MLRVFVFCSVFMVLLFVNLLSCITSKPVTNWFLLSVLNQHIWKENIITSSRLVLGEKRFLVLCLSSDSSANVIVFFQGWVIYEGFIKIVT